MPQTQTSAHPLTNLQADISLAAKRLASRDFETLEDVRAELLSNVYPAMGQLCEEMLEVDDIVASYVDNREAFIEPERAAVVFAALTVGTQLVDEIRKAKALDDVTKERIGKLCVEYERAAEIASRAVADIVDDEEEGDDDDKKDDSDNDSEDDEPDDGEETE